MAGNRPLIRRSSKNLPPGEGFLGTARSAGQQKRRIGKSDLAPRLPAAVVMRVQSSLNSGVGRRDDGAIDAHRTDSHDHRNHEDAAREGRIFVMAVFF